MALYGPECEGGVGVMWCPKCGDCSCYVDDISDREIGSDPECPLHGEKAAHGALFTTTWIDMRGKPLTRETFEKLGRALIGYKAY